jgi:hypothetical protein
MTPEQEALRAKAIKAMCKSIFKFEDQNISPDSWDDWLPEMTAAFDALHADFTVNARYAISDEQMRAASDCESDYRGGASHADISRAMAQAGDLTKAPK